MQRSLHIPNLSLEEVLGIFEWYKKESSQDMDDAVIQRLFYETRGQPGLTCWFGELLTETLNEKPEEPISIDAFNRVYYQAGNVLPNNNILNILSKTKQLPYKEVALELFRTGEKIEFKFEKEELNFLYMNGVIDLEQSGSRTFVRFASPFVQKKIFNRFSDEIFEYMGKLFEPLEDLSPVISDSGLDIIKLVRRYQDYLIRNKDWLLKDAPRRKDLRIFEAVYHFNLYRYLYDFLTPRSAMVYPEFPTGNGKIDSSASLTTSLVITYKGKTYALELKSYTDASGYSKALNKAASYGTQLGIKTIFLLFFVEQVGEENRKKYEAEYSEKESGVTVVPLFVMTGD
ncbi:MAG: hypothetical protein GY754_36640 [bacterium]|nr:hypothetical protein [bacterium]